MLKFLGEKAIILSTFLLETGVNGRSGDNGMAVGWNNRDELSPPSAWQDRSRKLRKTGKTKTVWIMVTLRAFFGVTINTSLVFLPHFVHMFLSL